MELTLWPACVKSHRFEDQLQAAAAGGFDSLPIGILTYRELRGRGLTPADILAMAEDSGVRLGHYDGFTDWAPERWAVSLPDAAKAVFDVSSEECLEVCEALGLDAICATGAFEAGAWPEESLVEGFSLFCEKAGMMGIRVDLEFIPMWGVPDLGAAWQIVQQVGRENAGILFDTWHFLRGIPDFELLATIPDGVIRTVQLADAAIALQGGSLLADCLHYRQLPGEGELDLRRVMKLLKLKKGIISIGPEVFSDDLDQMSAVEAGCYCSTASTAFLEGSGWGEWGN